MAETPTMQAAMAATLRSLAGRSVQTRNTYASGLRVFGRYLGGCRRDWSSMPTTAMTLEDFDEYHGWLVREYGRDRRATTNTYLAAVRALVKFLDHRGWLGPGVTYARVVGRLGELNGRGSYRAPRIDSGIPLVVTHALAMNVPTYPANADLTVLRDRAILATLYGTALRRVEVAALNRADLDDGRADHALITGKGQKDRTVFFDADSLAAIREYLGARDDSYAPLFIRHDRARQHPGPNGTRYRINAQTIWAVVKRYASAVGVRATPHAFRHTKASVLLNQGAQLSEVQDLLGHASPETTKKIYAHYETQRLRAVFDQCSVSASELVEKRGLSPQVEPTRPG